MVVGWLFLVALGIALVWYGFGQPETAGPPPTATEPGGLLPLTPLVNTPGATVPLPSPTPTAGPPTAAPLPTATPEPTAIPATPTPAVPLVRAGENGVNVRTGPGTNYPIIGFLQPGTEAPVTGRYGEWWQIQYGGTTGWVYNGVVTSANTEGVPQVVPPPSPTPVPPTATPTPTTSPTPSSVRGLVANNYWVEGAPGPYAANQDIWFNMDITNTSNQTVAYTALGTWVEETGQFQKSWSYSSFAPGQHFTHRDRINQFKLGPGSYHLWLMICFSDGTCVKLRGPISITVQ